MLLDGEDHKELLVVKIEKDPYAIKKFDNLPKVSESVQLINTDGT